MALIFSTIKSRIIEIWRHAGFQKYFRNTGWMFLGQMFVLLTSFFVGAWVARYLGPKEYGSLSYVLSFVGIFAFLSSLGLDSILNRELIKYPDNKNKLLGVGFVLKLFGAFIAIILISIISFFTNKDSLTNFFVIIFSITYIFQAFSVIDIYFKSQVLAKNVVIIQLSITFVLVILKILFIYFNLSLFWFLLCYILDIFLTMIGLIYFYRKTVNNLWDWRFDKVIAKNLLKDSLPLMLSNASILIYYRIDQVMLKHFLGSESVGIYSVATKLSEVWYFVPSIICTSVFPAILKAKENGQDLYYKRLKQLFKLMIVISLFIASSFFIFSHFIINILFGYEFLDAVGVLKIYTWSGIAVSLITVIGRYLLAENFVYIYFYITFMGAIINIILNILWIPRLDIGGAAWATLISYFFVVLSLFFFKKTRKDVLLILKY